MSSANRWNDPGEVAVRDVVSEEHTQRLRRRLILAGVAALLAVVVLLSWWSSRGPVVRSSPKGPTELDPTIFLDQATERISRLYEFVGADMVTTEMIVDRTASGKRLRAVLLDDPEVQGQQFTLLKVPRDQGRFESKSVQPGDTVYYYAKVPGDDKEFQVFRGITEPRAFELQVRDVLDESTLRLVGGLSDEVPYPQRVEVVRHVYRTEVQEQVDRWTSGETSDVNWEPSPDRVALVDVVERLNEWIKTEQFTATPVALLETLSVEDRHIYQAADPARTQFDFHDARFLQEVVWTRDIAAGARDERSALDKTLWMFDWTVRNIQLQADSTDTPPRRPWHTLLYGHGTAQQRGWVLALLARQAGLDVVQLAYPDPDDASKLRFWLPALMDDGKLYLLDTRLGLPIPGREAKSTATLSEVLADPKLLDRLDLDAKHPYAAKASDLKGLVALVETSPRFLTQRMRHLQDALVGDQRMVLAVDPDELAKQLKKNPGIANVRLSPQSAEFVRRSQALTKAEREKEWIEGFYLFAWSPRLWKARMLQLHRKFSPREIKGREFSGATGLYMDCREQRVRRKEIPTAHVWQEHQQQVKKLVKPYAEYWLGLIHYANADYGAAIDFLQQRLTAVDVNHVWADGARYNTARAYEARGKMKEARALYEADTSAQQFGNRLRARRLPKSSTKPASVDKKEPPKTDDSKPPEKNKPEPKPTENESIKKD